MKQSLKLKLRLLNLLGFTIILSGILGSSLISAPKAAAFTGSDFNAGHIIDDVIFTNSTAMSVSDIQNFLNAQLPTCDSSGSQSITYYYDTSGDQWNGEVDVSSDGNLVTTSRAIYGQRYAAWWNNNTTNSAGHQRSATYINNESITPYTCLPQYTENGLSAAQIIYNAAQQYQINPQVLITTLQKEQGLVTDNWPWLNEYEIAMGYACPDSAPCNSQYYGFTNQVNNAAAQFRRYLTNPNNYNYVVGSNNILFAPGCSTGAVTIQNEATAALYDYTPYQPNASVLAATNPTGSSAGPGSTSASCSSYGNRNFWWYFNTWFGSSLAPNFSAQPVWQAVYSDSTESTLLGWNATLVEGQSAYVVIQMKNTGNTTWTSSGAPGVSDTRLATYGPWGRQSAFCTSSWVATSPSCTRPAVLDQASVAPDQIGTFEFAVTAPNSPGVYNENFSPVVDGRSTFSSGVMNVQFTVVPPVYSSQPVSQAIYTDSTKSTLLGWNALLAPNENAWAVVRMENTGNVSWSNSGATPVRLATYPWGRISSFCAGRWIVTSPNCTRAATMDESNVAPGQIGTFEFPLNAPTGLNVYNENFGLVMDGKSVFSSGFVNLQLTNAGPTFSAQPVSQAVYTDSSQSTVLGWNATLSPGESAYIVVKMKNTGNTTWTHSGAPGVSDTRLVTFGPWGRQSAFCTSSWIVTSPSCTRPAAVTEANVGPGQTGTFAFPITAPTKTGVYNENFGLVVDGRTLFNSGVVNVQLTVQ